MGKLDLDHVASHAEPALPKPAPTTSSRACILVADDNEINRVVVTEQLLQLGYRVESVGNGLEALQRAQQGGYAAVLMDCEMPVMDGYEAAREIRRREAGSSRVPIIAVTAYEGNGDRDRMLAAGMDACLNKPLSTDELQKALGHWLHGKTAVGSQADARMLRNIDAADPELDPATQRYAEVMLLFLDLAPVEIQSVSEALARGDVQRAWSHAHRLKGSALALGACRMAQVARELERAIQVGLLADARRASDSLAERFERVRLLLNEEIVLRPSGKPLGGPA